MTTTLRINQELYRKAKVAAASQQITLTKFIEEGLELRLTIQPQQIAQAFVVLPTFDSGKHFDMSPEDIKAQLAQLDAHAVAQQFSSYE